MQPFDGGKFDKRYRDTFCPAITDAGLDPYRVDADPAVSIPIIQIEDGIKQASVCFADITLDNPNVWFELGYALASGKEICMICSEERQGKFPFDIQHRSIIKYRVDSPSDYDALKDRITNRLEAILKREYTMTSINAQSLLKEEDGLTKHETVVLTAIVENQEGLQDGVTHWALKNQMERLGYNNLAVNIGVSGLIRRNMIETRQIMPHDHSDEPVTGYLVKPLGHDWLIENVDILKLTT